MGSPAHRARLTATSGELIKHPMFWAAAPVEQRTARLRKGMRDAKPGSQRIGVFIGSSSVQQVVSGRLIGCETHRVEFPQRGQGGITLRWYSPIRDRPYRGHPAIGKKLHAKELSL